MPVILRPMVPIARVGLLQYQLPKDPSTTFREGCTRQSAPCRVYASRCGLIHSTLVVCVGVYVSVSGITIAQVYANVNRFMQNW